MAFNTGDPIVADEINNILDYKLNCHHYNIPPQSTTNTTLYAGTLIVFLHTFSECAMSVVRNEFDNPAGPKSFAHAIKTGSNLSISTYNGQLSLTNSDPNVGGTALVLAY